jgi:hypothetical protein
MIMSASYHEALPDTGCEMGYGRFSRELWMSVENMALGLPDAAMGVEKDKDYPHLDGVAAGPMICRREMC